MVSRKGVPRVVWERQRKGCINGEQVDFIPFLSVSRSLGDFWSYCPRSGEFVVSPRPDVHCFTLNTKVQKFVVIASDGLWNVMSPREVVEFIWDYEHEREEKLHQPKDVVRAVINEALSRWNSKHLLADNIAVLIAFLSDDDSCSPSVANVNSTVEEEVCTSSSTATGETPASTASPTPSTSSFVDGESSEPRDNPAPPPSAPPASSASPSTSSTSPSPSVPPSSSSSQSQEQQSQTPDTINTVQLTKSGSTTHYKETFPDGVTVECHTKIRLRHRKKHRHHHSKVKTPSDCSSSGTASDGSGASTSTFSLDPTGSLQRSPLKRERSTEDASTSDTDFASKRAKLDLPDSGCDCKMDADGSSPDPLPHIAAAVCGQDQASSDYSSGVYSDDSESRNKLADNCQR